MNRIYLKEKLNFFGGNYAKRGYTVPVNPKDFVGGRAYEFKTFFSFLNPKKNDKLIELGCGYGKFVLPLLYLGYTITGVDISSNCLQAIKEQAKKYKLLKKLKIVKSDFTKKVFDKKYDKAFCISTFHLLSDTQEEREKILVNLIDSVKIGGEIIVVEPNPFNPFLYVLYLATSQAQWEIERHFLKSTEKYLHTLFKKNGLKKIEIMHIGFFPLRWMENPLVRKINGFITSTSLLKHFSTFIYIKGTKKS